MRSLLFALSMLLCPLISAHAQVSVGISINLPGYPELAPIPGYPVYYAPRARTNYFFYDGLYWVYEGDNWYASNWYNGPWQLVSPEDVPLFVLRIPVRYYRRPPVYFRGWNGNAPPHWGNIGAATGKSVAADGINGTIGPHHLRRRCRIINAGILETAILARQSSRT